MNPATTWQERKERYSTTILNMAKVRQLAEEVARAVHRPSQVVTYNVNRSKTVTAEEWQTQTVTREVPRIFGGTRVVEEKKRVLVPVSRTVTESVRETFGARCWEIDARRWSVKEDRSTGQGEYVEDVETYRTYLRSDGVLAQVCEEWRDAYMNKRFETTDLGVTVVTPLPEALVCQFDFERRQFRQHDGRRYYDSNRDPSDRLKTFVHAKGDGIRAMLLTLTPEDQQAILRRKYPNLAKDQEWLPSHSGRVLRFSRERGFGFIGADTVQGDVFVHQNQVPEEQRNLLAPGALLTFDVRQGAKGPTAQNVRIVG